jgi:hypothetical protein
MGASLWNQSCAPNLPTAAAQRMSKLLLILCLHMIPSSSSSSSSSSLSFSLPSFLSPRSSLLLVFLFQLFPVLCFDSRSFLELF